MTGKVKCTCGWSWNKSDSSKKDMYICHECGRDNSNNMKDGGWLDKAQTGKIVPPETEIAKAKRVARKVAGSSGIGLALDQFPGVETAYDLYNIADAYKQGDPMKIIPNVMGALLPGLSGKSFEAISDEYLPKTPKKEKEKFKAVSKGKRASIEEIKKAQESVDWSTGFKKLYDDAGEIGTDIKNTIDDTVSPLMGLKNGGWLDNYNDSEVSFPEGFVGEGIFNGPKFDNPAWGGQFQNGGWLEKIDNVLSAPARAATYAIEAGAHAIGARKAPPKYEDPSGGLGIDEKKHPYLKLATNIVLDPTNLLGVGAISKIGKLAKGIKTVEKTKNVLQPTVKAAFDAATKAGKASGAITWGRNLGKQHKAFFKEYDVLLKNMYKPEIVEQALKLGAKDAIGATAIINDLIKQHPEKKEEILKNYKNISKQNTNKNPQQQVIVKPTTTKETTKPFVPTKYWTDPETGIRYTEKPIKPPVPQKRQPVKSIQNNLQPEGIENDFSIDAQLPVIRPDARMPKYYDVEDYTQGSANYIGNQTNYRTSDLSTLSEQTSGNTRKIIPHYQMGGNLPGAVGNMYARTGSPSKGPRRNQTDVTDASAQNGKEMQYYQNGLDWKPKSISRDGSVIKDDRGQWDHPGEITEIGSNEITMKGVPYDVLGVSDTGDTKLMKPGKNYKFKGKKVTEYPMAKNGVNQQDQKTLQQLDQLTNFTNYNKPTIGGWLNKYN